MNTNAIANGEYSFTLLLPILFCMLLMNPLGGAITNSLDSFKEPID